MTIQLYIGFISEGPTDNRFLPDIIEKLFTEIACDCYNDIIIEQIFALSKQSGSFVDTMIDASKEAQQKGASMLCIHADSDSRNLTDVYTYKIGPYIKALSNKDDDNYCKCIVPIIPIQMIESWLMADKTLLKQQINALNYNDTALGLHRRPEQYADPKQAIENAIAIVMQNRPKRRRDELSISDLYEPIGAAIDINSLRTLPSFQDFELKTREAFRQLGYLK